MRSPSDPHTDSVEVPPAALQLSPELEDELRLAVEDIERGDYVDLTDEELDRWADAGVVPSLDASLD
jgi:hypothetical protein